MATKTTLEIIQGTTAIFPFECSSADDPSPDFTGWRVILMVKKNTGQDNADALINEDLTVDPVSGIANRTFTDEETAAFEVGTYVGQAVVVDGDGNVGKTQLFDLVVKDTTYKGAVA
jgi:hypothetical protein